MAQEVLEPEEEDVDADNKIHFKETDISVINKSSFLFLNEMMVFLCGT